jgi:glyoxylase-like metal-dependent hydrolase (beta-lactamase superfamily II)
MLVAALLAACTAAPAPESDSVSAGPDALGQGAHLIAGVNEAGRSPNGNTVVFDGRTGLIVFDTGRRPSHAQRILAYATARSRPITAIINSHWHLDHIDGNLALRDAFPKAAVYSSDAALTEALNSFLAGGAKSNRERLAKGDLTPGQKEDAEADLAAVENGQRLRPTIPIETTQTLSIDGRKLELHAAKGASAGDVWLYDPQAKLVLSGDLITLPAPFFDTACPIAWTQGLNAILDKPFERVVPGHGRVMARADVVIYRDAFNALVKCARSTEEAASCGDKWASAVASLQEPQEADGRRARGYAVAYINGLFRAGQKRADCPE